MTHRHITLILALSLLSLLTALGSLSCNDDAGNASVETDNNDIIDNNDDGEQTNNNDVGDNNDVAEDNFDDRADVGIPGVHDDVEVLDRRRVRVNSGRIVDYQVEIPPDTISVTVTAVGDDRTYFTLSKWIDPDGVELVTDGWVDFGQPSLCTSCINRVSAASGASAALAPNNQDAFITPGTHTISIYAYTQRDPFNPTIPASGEVEVTVKAKVRPELPVEGVLDLNLHFTGAGGWTAQSARTDEEFQKVLDDVDAIYSQVGLRLGRVACVVRGSDPIYSVPASSVSLPLSQVLSTSTPSTASWRTSCSTTPSSRSSSRSPQTTPSTRSISSSSRSSPSGSPAARTLA